MLDLTTKQIIKWEEFISKPIPVNKLPRKILFLIESYDIHVLAINNFLSHIYRLDIYDIKSTVSFETSYKKILIKYDRYDQMLGTLSDLFFSNLIVNDDLFSKKHLSADQFWTLYNLLLKNIEVIRRKIGNWCISQTGKWLNFFNQFTINFIFDKKSIKKSLKKGMKKRSWKYAQKHYLTTVRSNFLYIWEMKNPTLTNEIIIKSQTTSSQT